MVPSSPHSPLVRDATFPPPDLRRHRRRARLSRGGRKISDHNQGFFTFCYLKEGTMGVRVFHIVTLAKAFGILVVLIHCVY
jgi:hypothetical protein